METACAIANFFSVSVDDLLKENKSEIDNYDSIKKGTSSSIRQAIYLASEDREKRIQELVSELENTIVFVVADHGLINVENIHLSDYPTLVNMLERTPSIEQRSCSFKVKEEFKKQFKIEFNQHLGQYFTLLSKEEIMELKLFGDGIPNPNYEAAIGDYIAIATNSNKTLIGEHDWPLASQHAGLLDDEVYVPLIMLEGRK